MGLMRLSLATLGVVFMMACGPGLDVKSGGDHQRGKPQDLELGKLVYDRVSADDGDHTDWKMFEIAQPTAVTVRIWWDQPEVKGSVFLRGRTEGVTRKLKHKKGTRSETIGPVALLPGKWYLRIQLKSGTSVYSLRIDTGEAGEDSSDLPDF